MAGTHPSLEYVLVGAVAAGGTFLATPIARGLAVGWGAIARPRDRDVHAVAIPRLGEASRAGGPPMGGHPFGGGNGPAAPPTLPPCPQRS